MISPRDLYLRNHPVLARLVASGDRAAIRRFLTNNPGIATGWQRVMGATQATLAQPARASAPASGAAGAGSAARASAPASAARASAPASAAAGAGGPSVPLYDENALDVLKKIYKSYGLEDLADVLYDFAVKGIEDHDTVEILLRENEIFQNRFSANKIRKAKDMNVLSVGDYLRLEDSYSSIMRSSGLPAGFYDSRDDFTNWIANDVSAEEIKDRVLWAQQMTKGADTATKQALMEYENLGDGDITAFFLDQKRATTLFETQKAFGSAQIGGAARRQGLNIAEDRAKAFYDQGVTGAQANQAFGAVAEVTPRAQTLGGIYGQGYSQTDAEDEFLGGLASARRKRESLAEKEVASFGGKSGAGRGSLSRRRRGQY